MGGHRKHSQALSHAIHAVRMPGTDAVRETVASRLEPMSEEDKQEQQAEAKLQGLSGEARTALQQPMVPLKGAWHAQ